MASSIAHLFSILCRTTEIEAFDGAKLIDIVRYCVRRLILGDETGYVLVFKDILCRKSLPILSSCFNLQIKTLNCYHFFGDSEWPEVSICDVPFSITTVALDAARTKRLMVESLSEDFVAGKGKQISLDSCMHTYSGLCSQDDGPGGSSRQTGFECACGITDDGFLITYYKCPHDTSDVDKLLALVIRSTIDLYRSKVGRHFSRSLLAYCPTNDTVRKSAFALTSFSSSGSFDVVRGRPIVVTNRFSLGREMSASTVVAAESESCCHRDQEIYLLMGQSNMSGRGDLEEVRRAAMRVRAHTSTIPGTDSSVLTSDDCRSISSSHSDCFVLGNQNCPCISQVQEKCSYFDPIDGWVALSSSNSIRMHENVDIMKSVGIGPGVGFVCQRLQMHNNHNNQSSGTLGILAIKLIPAAAGSTSLDEWAPDYLLPLPPSSSSAAAAAVVGANDSFYTAPPPNAQYHEGCPNILSCAMRSLFLALMALPDADTSTPTSETTTTPRTKTTSRYDGSNVGVDGILWYQGENDATLPPDRAASYGERFSSFLEDLRWLVSVVESIVNTLRRGGGGGGREEGSEEWELSLPQYLSPVCEDDGAIQPLSSSDSGNSTLFPLPIVTTAITSTRPWLRELSTIRHQQLARQYNISNDSSNSSSSSSSSIAVVDAFGRMLKPDCIHLTADSAIIVGEQMAVEMVGLLRRRGNIGTGGTIGSDFSEHDGDQCSRDTETETTAMSMHSVVELAEEQFQSVRSIVDRNLRLPSLQSCITCDKEPNNDPTAAAAKPAAISGETTFEKHRQPQQAPAAAIENIRKSGIKFVNFTYGEICFRDFCCLLFMVNLPSRRGTPTDHTAATQEAAARTGIITDTDSISPASRRRKERKFVDLGCGAGAAVAAALLTSSSSAFPGYPSFTHIVGIDMLHTKIEECQMLVQQLLLLVPTDIPPPPRSMLPTAQHPEDDCLERVRAQARSRLTAMTALSPLQHEGKESKTIEPPIVHVVESNFLELDWSDADVVYACATCFDTHLLLAMANKLRLLRLGARVIILDALVLSGKDKDGSPFPPIRCGDGGDLSGGSDSDASTTDNSETSKSVIPIEEVFDMIGSCQVSCSWGSASAFIYEKTIV